MKVKDVLLKGDALVAQAEIDKDMQAYLHSKPYLQWWDGASFLGYNLWHTHVALLAGRLAALGYVKVITCGQCAWWKPRKPDGGKRVGYCTLVGWEPSLYPEWHYCSEGEPKEGVND